MKAFALTRVGRAAAHRPRAMSSVVDPPPFTFQRSQTTGQAGTVFGQIVACNAIRAVMERTQSPMTFIDPAAGEGIWKVKRKNVYPMIERGADRLWENEKNPSTRVKRQKFFRDYIKILKHNNIGKDGYLYDTLQYYPSNAEICRHFMRPFDRLICAEEDPQRFKILASNYGHDPRITLLNMSPAEAMRTQLPTRNPHGVVVYDCNALEEPADFIRYLDRAPLATVCITYTGRGDMTDILTDLELDSKDKDATPDMSHRSREKSTDIYRRIVQRGYKFVMGCECTFRSGKGWPNMGGCLVANPATHFDVMLETHMESAQKELERWLKAGPEAKGTPNPQYFWATKTPVWYKKMLGNYHKLPWNYQTTDPAEVRAVRGTKSGKNQRRRERARKEDVQMRRTLGKINAFRRGKLRRRYVGDFKEDTDPADFLEVGLPRVRHSPKWKKKTVREQKANRNARLGGNV